MPKHPSQPQVPGEAVDETAPEGDQNAGLSEVETVAVPKAQLDALMARIAALEGGQTVRRANPDADLPDQSEVDSATIKAPVMTKQGWIVPDKFGYNPPKV